MSSSSTYSEDDTIAAVTAYYEFLVHMFLPDESIMYPPLEGWDFPSDITFLPPKDQKVTSLMRRLPYLKPPANWEHAYMYEKCEAINYTTLKGSGPHDIDPEPDETLIPSNVLMIGFTPGRNGHHIFIDTDRGTATLCDFQTGGKGGTELSQDPDSLEGALRRITDDGDEHKENWRAHPTYVIPEFFEILKRQFQELDVIPHPKGDIEFRRFPPGIDLEGDSLKAIFHNCGWPGQAYMKDECMRRVREFDGESDDEDDSE